MRVLLINPFDDYHMGLAYICSYLKKFGHDVLIYNFKANRKIYSFKNSRSYKDCISWKPNVVGITINEINYEIVKEIIVELKEGLEAVYVAGGLYVTLHKENFLIRNLVFDYAIYGEGEETIKELLEALNRKMDFENINGLIFRKDNRVKINQPRPFLNLNSLPFPDLKVHNYKHYFYPILTSRGCPYNCSFCPNGLMWDKTWRARTTENVINEIKYVISKYSCYNFSIIDDNFTLDYARAKELLKKIINERLNIQFELSNGIRADNVDEELVALLKKSGCCRIAIGIENGDKSTFKYAQKGESLEDIEKAVRLIKKYKIPVEGFMLIGLINTDAKSVYRSIRFIKKLDILARWYIVIPSYGTLQYKWVEENGWFLKEINYSSGTWSAQPPIFFETKMFPKKEMLKMHHIANIESKNYLFLTSGRTNFTRALTGFIRVFYYRPTKIFGYILFILKCLIKPHTVTLNRKITKNKLF